MSGPAEPEGRRARYLRYGLGVVGIVAVVLVVRHVTPGRLFEHVVAALPWLPLAIAIEVARVALEAQATLCLYGDARAAVPAAAWIRAALVSYTPFVLSPAGRTAAEATKATFLSRHVGPARASAAAIAGQGLGLLAAGVVSIPCALAAARPGAWDLASAILVQGLGVLALGGAVLFASRRERVTRVLAWLVDRATGSAVERREELGTELLRLPAVPAAPLLWFTLARAVSVLGFLVLMVAVGGPAEPGAVLRATGVSLVGSVAVDLFPGDVGLTESTFALWHDAIGVSLPRAVAVAVLFHVVQLIGVVASTVGAFAWRAREGE